VRSICLAALVVCACTAAAVQDNIEFGLLTCTLSEHTAVEPGAATQARDVMCTFKVRSGAQETYLGKVEVVNISATEKITLVWRVKVPRRTPAAPGPLEQNYAADPRTPPNQVPDLVGQANSELSSNPWPTTRRAAPARRRDHRWIALLFSG